MLTEKWKLVDKRSFDSKHQVVKKTIETELYAIDTDPYETIDVADQHRKRAKEMLAALRCWENDDCTLPARWR